MCDETLGTIGVKDERRDPVPINELIGDEEEDPEYVDDSERLAVAVIVLDILAFDDNDSLIVFDTVTLEDPLPSADETVVTLPLKETRDVNVDSGVLVVVLVANIDLEIDGDEDNDRVAKDVEEIEVDVEDDVEKLMSCTVRVGLSFESVASDDCVVEKEAEPDALGVIDTQLDAVADWDE